MTDMPDGSGQIPRRSSRVGDGGAPVSGALAIALAVVAVVAGFLILNSLSGDAENQADFPPTEDDGGAAAQGNTDGSGEVVDEGTGDSSPSMPTTTTQPAIVTEGASVIVANANGAGGSAGAMTRAIETGAGFTVVEATDATSSLDAIADSVIYYLPDNPAAQPVAESLARVLGGASVSPMPPTPPTSDGSLNGADVLLMLGKDKANKTLEELVPAASGEVTVSNPPVAGDTTDTTPADG